MNNWNSSSYGLITHDRHRAGRTGTFNPVNIPTSAIWIGRRFRLILSRHVFFRSANCKALVIPDAVGLDIVH
jgi:hypothetical protein